jgi:arylsulfatase A-like enzyme
MADQFRADALGCFGNPIVRTPNLDRLAAGGVGFENAFVQSPVCMASRAAIHTGRYPRTCRVPSMGLLPPDEVTLAETLKRHGYATGTFGKLHLTPMGTQWLDRHQAHEDDDALSFLEPTGLTAPHWRAVARDPCKRNFGFDVAVGVGDMLWGHYFDWLGRVAPEHVPHAASESWGIGRGGFKFGDSPPATRLFPEHVRDFFDSHLPAEVHPSQFIVDQARAFVRANRDRPFFVHCSFVDPHHPFNAPIPYNRAYAPGEMPLPAPLDAAACFPPDLPPPVARSVARGRTFPPELWQWMLANYYGMVSHVDHCAGALLDEIRSQGLWEDTVVVFIADHGEYAGDHHLLYKGSLHFDSLMRVPMIVAHGNRAQAGRRVRALVQEIDVYPTIMGLLGLPIHAGVQGKDLSAVVLGGSEDGYEVVTCELDTLPDATYQTSQTVRTAEWKLEVFPLAGTGMLFDIKNDPGETRNLYRDPAHARVRDALTFDLLRHLCQSKDPLPIRLRGA